MASKKKAPKKKAKAPAKKKTAAKKTAKKSAAKKTSAKAPAKKKATPKQNEANEKAKGKVAAKQAKTGDFRANKNGTLDSMTIGGVVVGSRELAVMLVRTRPNDPNLSNALDLLMGKPENGEAVSLFLSEVWQGVPVDSHAEAMQYAAAVAKYAGNHGVQVSVSFEGVPMCSAR